MAISPTAARNLNAIAACAADDAIVASCLTASQSNVGACAVRIAEIALGSLDVAKPRSDAAKKLTSATGTAKSLALAIPAAAGGNLPSPAALRGWHLLKGGVSPAEVVRQALAALSAARTAAGEAGPDDGEDCGLSPSSGKLIARGAYGATPAQAAYRALSQQGAILAQLEDLKVGMEAAEAGALQAPAAAPRKAKAKAA